MITVVFHGNLKSYGTFKLYADSPREALHGLFCQIQGLREKIRAGTFLVRLNGEIQNENNIVDNFKQPKSHAIVHIVPRVAGAGRAGQVIAGAVLVAAGYFVTGLSYGWAAPIGAAMINVGVGIMFGGIAQMLSKPPSFDSNTQGQKASRNTAFSNLDNTIAQGQPVPLAYGLVYAGSRVISQGVESRRVSQYDPILNNPTAQNVTLNIRKTFVSGVAAIAPDGQVYNTDFADDSVRARNYIAHLIDEK